MKKLITGIIIGVMLVTPSMAENVDVIMNKIKITVNNQQVEGDNILVNGRTFVPLRAIGEMLGKEVIWNADINTASINDKLPADWSEVKTFEGDTSKSTETFKITGKEARVTWESLDKGFFSATLYSLPDEYVESIASAMDKKSEVTYIRKSGEYFLKISATVKYKIKIEQRP
jgi:hypothetical protein